MRILAALVLLAGCSFGLGEARGWDAAARGVNAREVWVLAESLQEAVSSTEPAVQEEVAWIVDDIQERAVDEAQRAEIAKQDHGYPPEEEVVPRSPKDDAEVQAWAGLAKAGEVKRKVRRELPGKIAAAAASVVANVVLGITPKPVKLALKWAMYGLVAYGVIMTGLTFTLWLARRFWRRATHEGIESINRLPKEQRKEITAGEHALGAAFEKEKKHG